MGSFWGHFGYIWSPFDGFLGLFRPKILKEKIGFSPEIDFWTRIRKKIDFFVSVGVCPRTLGNLSPVPGHWTPMMTPMTMPRSQLEQPLSAPCVLGARSSWSWRGEEGLSGRCRFRCRRAAGLARLRAGRCCSHLMPPSYA